MLLLIHIVSHLKGSVAHVERKPHLQPKCERNFWHLLLGINANKRHSYCVFQLSTRVGWSVPHLDQRWWRRTARLDVHRDGEGCPLHCQDQIGYEALQAKAQPRVNKLIECSKLCNCNSTKSAWLKMWGSKLFLPGGLKWLQLLEQHSIALPFTLFYSKLQSQSCNHFGFQIIYHII